MDLPDHEKILVFSMIALAAILAALFLISGPETRTVSARTELVSTLVIDAGHGGDDGGASTKEGIRESVINLAIAQKMAAISDFCGIRYVMTRDSEEIDYPSQLKTIHKRKVYDQNMRIDLVNNIKNAVLISIHQNKFSSPQPRGPQTFYNMVEGSKELADLMQENMNKVLYPENRRIAVKADKDVYMMKKVSCKAVLAECGFLSNPTEAAALITDEYQLKVALCIISAYCIYNDMI